MQVTASDIFDHYHSNILIEMEVIELKSFSHDGNEYHAVATLENMKVRARVYHDEKATDPADPSSYWFSPDQHQDFDMVEFLASSGDRGPIESLLSAAISGFKLMKNYQSVE